MGHSTRSCHLAAIALLALAAALTPWSAARAATLNLVADDLVYDPGDTITMRLVGDSEGATDNVLGAILLIDQTILLDVQVQQFSPLMQDGAPWLIGRSVGPAALTCFINDRECILMNMVHQTGRVGVDPSVVEPFTYAVLTATAGTPGVHALEFVSTPTTRRIDFFGLTSAPGITITITGDPPPPPPLAPPPPPPAPPAPPVVAAPPSDPSNDPPPVVPSVPATAAAGAVAAVPEPGAALLFALGVACVRLRLRRSATA